MFAVRCGRNLMVLAVVVLAGLLSVVLPSSALAADPFDPQPSKILIKGPSVTEGDSGRTTYEAEVSAANNGAQRAPECGYTARWRTVAGSAQAGSDYVEVSNGIELVQPRQPSYDLPVKIVGDTMRELWEKFYIEITVPATCGSSLTVTRRFDITIYNDDHGNALFAEWRVGLREVDPGQGTVNATFEIRRDEAIGLSTAKWRTADGTAKAGSDYTARNGTVTFDGTQNVQRVTVPILADLVKEDPETFSVKLSDPTGTVILNDTAPATISDNDQLQGLRINDVQVTEGQSGTRLATFQVSRLGVRDTAASVRWSTGDVAPPPTTSGGSGQRVTPYDGGQATSERPATAGEDYTPVTSRLLEFAPGESVKNVSVTIRGDTVPEPDENLWVTLSSPSGVSILPNGAVGLAKIATDDTGFWVNDREVDEDPLDVPLSYDPFDAWGAPVAQPPAPKFTIWRTGPVNTWSQVNWDLYNGTAIAFYDFVGDFGTVYFAPGETSRRVPLTIRRDQEPEGDEQFTIVLSEAIGAGIAKDTGVVTIDDDDGFVIDDVRVTETSSGTSLANFDIRLTGPAATATSVRWATADTGTADGGVDYRADAGTVSFAAGETKKTVSVVINGDAAAEKAEYFSVSLSASQGADVVDGSAIGTIFNAAQGLKVGDASVTEGNAGTRQLTFEVERVGVPTGAVTATWYTKDVPTQGSAGAEALAPVLTAYEELPVSPASPGSDYTAVTNRTVSFAAGQTKATISVTVNGDTTAENHERLEVRIGSVIGTQSIIDGSGLGTILTDDSGVSVIDATITEGLRGSRPEEVTIARRGSVLGTAWVDWAVTAWTAGSPSDSFTPASGTVKFDSGETTKTFPVMITGDSTAEGDELVLVTLSSPVGTGITDATGSVTIADDDGLTVDDVTVVEPLTGTTSATFTIRLNGPARTPVSVDWATSANGPTGTRAATAGTDYSAVTRTRRVEFAVGETSKQVSVSVRSDTTAEPTEAFGVYLSTPKGAAILDATAHARILDYKPGVYIDNVSLPEGDSGSRQAQFTLTRVGDVSQPASVTATRSNDTAGAGGTEFSGNYVYTSSPAVPGATGGSDYTIGSPTTASFAAGQRTTTVSVPVHGDSDLEFSETFFVTLSNAAGTTIGDNRGVGLIVNDD